MKKALGQTVRDLKREVNKKVLKVPSIEQKVLDATSNEPWGPHGSHLADIAQATRNYHEYQMIMSVIWKRVNDTGKNWRHVYKALTVLEYLVANGSERVIDEIREHAYQISTLSNFQYIDSSGRDQGSNVRKKSQSLVVLVNDKERIQEVRQKAAANRDKFRNTSMGGMYKPGSYSGVGGYGERYDDDRYGSRDEDRNGYGRERDWDSNSRDSDRYGRDSEERYGRDGYRDDDSRGRSRSIDPYNYGSRSRSADRDRDRSYEDGGQFSSRGSAAKADDRSQDGSVAGRRLDRKYSEQNLGVPPSYEEAVGDARSPTHSERDGETLAATSAPKSSSPSLTTSHKETTTSSTPVAPGPAPSPAPTPAPAAAPPPLSPAPAPAPVSVSENNEFDGFDEFDPRGFFKAAPTSSNSAEADFTSDPYSLNSLAIVPTTTATATSESGAFKSFGSGNGFPSESTAFNQPFEDPFGDGPFRAISSSDSFPAQQQNVASTSSFHPNSNHSDPRQQTSPNTEAVTNFGFGDTDVLADIFPPSGSSPIGFPSQTGHPSSQAGFQGQMGQPSSMTGYPEQAGQQAPQTGFQGQMGQPSSVMGYPEQAGQHAPQAGFPHPGGQHASLIGFPSHMGTAQQAGFPAPSQPAQPGANFNGSFNQQQGSTAPVVQPTSQTPTGLPAQYNNMNFNPQSGSQMVHQKQQAGLSAHHRTSSLPASTNSLAIVPQPAKDKFETKSTVWADTLNRGLVNLNISGSKTNPLADIGVDFDAINRKEKRMEKPSQNPVVSTVTMGKAMGSGSGIGRAGAGAIRGAPNPMMGSGFHTGMGSAPGGGIGMGGGRGPGMGGGPGAGMGMGMGLGGGPGVGMGTGGGYGVNQPMGGMGMRMNMGMGQGVQMQQPPTGFPPGSNMPGGYNPMMGTGNYGQQPYNGGYR